MKVNETPEKIYINSNLENRTWLIGKGDTSFVEYTRTDAFIEKALAYLHNKFYFNDVFYGIVSTDFNAMEEMYEDFKKNMKGE